MHVLDSTSASSRLVSGGEWLEAVLPPQIVCLLIQTTGDSGLRSGLKIKTVGLCPRPHAPTGSGESSTYSCGAVLLSFKKLMTFLNFFFIVFVNQCFRREIFQWGSVQWRNFG
jgi:hypothetical protein